jgi:tetratricopeptide (TPR) repeat protein
MHAKKPSVSNMPPLDADVSEVLNDALDTRYKSSESALEDIQEAFNKIPRQNIESIAAMMRDMANEEMRSERYADAAEHYTSVLAAHPADHEVLANRCLAYLKLDMGQEALQDAALCVNLKPDWAKGYYRLGCALEACKQWKDSAAVFAKVVEMEPGNAEASGRLIKAREMLQMVLNVERVQDPHWMHKPEPERTSLQKRTEEAAALNDSAMNAIREELGACCSRRRMCRNVSFPPLTSRSSP